MVKNIVDKIVLELENSRIQIYTCVDGGHDECGKRFRQSVSTV